MKSSVFKHTWMQGKPNEIAFEVHWNEYIKTFMKSSVFKHIWMQEASIIKNRCNKYMDQGYGKSKAQKNNGS